MILFSSMDLKFPTRTRIGLAKLCSGYLPAVVCGAKLFRRSFDFIYKEHLSVLNAGRASRDTAKAVYLRNKMKQEPGLSLSSMNSLRHIYDLQEQVVDELQIAEGCAERDICARDQVHVLRLEPATLYLKGPRVLQAALSVPQPVGGQGPGDNQRREPLPVQRRRPRLGLPLEHTHYKQIFLSELNLN
ncbi:hypothetical protein BpHYR1_005562 [Brachionus plicatilis]|uniref:Uncharacterized protein n=1 Tax=Brachionus plicatilis TaxID=10195 RepID=A0A3M7T6J3_BRAPC|nr:hypothetical protein BpHYR1_005562 [Brachionus plicatilis]